MLILTRRAQQAFQIGADIVITVMDIRGTQVRIGVDAPHDVMVLRSEVPDKTGKAERLPDSSP